MKNTLKFLAACLIIIIVINGCKGPKQYREEADKVAYDIIHDAEKDIFDRESVFTIEKPEDALRRRLMEAQGLQYSHNGSLGMENLDKPEFWPEENFPPVAEQLDNLEKYSDQIILSLDEALMIAAKNSFEYQSRKENVFSAALNLDLAENVFRNIYSGSTSHSITADTDVPTSPSGEDVLVTADNSAEFGISKMLKNGARISASLAMSIANLLTFGDNASKGFGADASVSIPLLRGSGEHIVLEELTQTQRNLVYAVYEFERYKKEFAVNIAGSYFSVLRQRNQIANAKANYDSVKISAGKSRKLAETGRMSNVERDQAVQDELDARNNWISTQQSYNSTLDSFKTTLGLPPDADIELNSDELEKLVEYTGKSLDINLKPDLKTPVEFKDIPGPYELDEKLAIELALKNRLDLKVSQGEVYDRQRNVIIRADRLRAEVTLNGSAQFSDSNAKSLLNDGQYRALLTIDLPIERTSERNSYRESFISLDRSVRSLQQTEDQIKLEVRNKLRRLQEQRLSLQIQAESVRLAQNRVRSTTMYLEDGRVQMRDLLDAERSLLSAKNNITSSIVTYRLTELELQRDLGLLTIDNDGLWVEFDPKNIDANQTPAAAKHEQSSTDA